VGDWHSPQAAAQGFGATLLALAIGSPPQIVPADPDVFESGSQFDRLNKLRALLPDWAPRSIADDLRATVPWYLGHLRRERS
jgi:hypothetical protein